MYMPGNFLTKLSTSTVAEIQGHIIERGKRNAISRRYHTKDDKEAIATWRLDLNGILHNFHVCSVISVWRLLTFRFQNELWITIHPTVSGTHQDTAAIKHTIVSDIHRDISNTEVIVPDFHNDVSSTQPIVSGVRSDIANTRAVVSGLDHTKLRSREPGADGRNQAVSTAHTLPFTE